MRRKITLALYFFLGVFVSPAIAQDSCSSPATETQAAICKNPDLQALDNTLKSEFDAVMEKLEGEQKWSEHLRQSTWLERRNICGPYSGCIARVYRNELARLKALGNSSTETSQKGRFFSGVNLPKWCANANMNADEKTICSHENLYENENKLSQLYKASIGKIKKSGGDTKWLVEEQRRWALSRKKCEINVECLDNVYQKRIVELSNFGDIGKLYYGSRAGMFVTIISREGIGTEHAKIVTRLMPEDAKVYCVEYESDYSAECVRRTMDIEIKNYVSGNCRKKTWSDLFGETYSFEDVIRLDDSVSSGKDRALAIYNELCNR